MTLSWKNALFVEVRVSIRAAAPTDEELHEEAAVFPTAAGQEEHSATCRMLMNFSQNITSKSLKISDPIFLISPKKVDKSRRWTEVGPKSWGEPLRWWHNATLSLLVAMRKWHQEP